MRLLVILIIHTGRTPLPRSRPAAAVMIAALAVGTGAGALPYTAAGARLGLHPLPPLLLGALAATIVAYLATLQATKYVYRRVIGHSL